MMIVELIGGLGNQLFEYANARALSIALNQELFFDMSFFDRWKHDVYRLDKFNTKIKKAKDEDIRRLKRKAKKPDIYRKISRHLGFSPYQNGIFHFDEKWIQGKNIKSLKKVKDLYISGYFANQRYFINIEEVLRKEFTFKNGLNRENKKFENLILNTNAVSLHIRRGDYVNNNYFANIPIEYYHRAIKEIEKKYPNSEYFVFSDDLNWVEDNLITDVNLNFVDINDSKTDYMDLYLMSICKHNIIANSTFSWWGAWLNKNLEKIVIAPKVWFKNYDAQLKYEQGGLVPNNWIKI